MDGDAMLQLLGARLDDTAVQALLRDFARGMQPELDPDDDGEYVDWITLNESGLEFGFEDEAFVRAWDEKRRRKGPLLLSQLYFYGETDRMRACSLALPFGLNLANDRSSVRAKLARFEPLRRSYVRDAWRLDRCNLTVAYRSGTQQLESVLCYLPHAPWPTAPGPVTTLAPQEFQSLFGLRWSNARLRDSLAPFGLEGHLREVRTEHLADLLREHGLEFHFAESSRIPAAETRYPRALCFAAVSYHTARELDARQWQGPLPHGLSFDDTQHELVDKLKSPPAKQNDETLTGLAVWHFTDHSLSVLYSNLENRLLRVTLMAPGYWP